MLDPLLPNFPQSQVLDNYKFCQTICSAVSFDLLQEITIAASSHIDWF